MQSLLSLVISLVLLLAAAGLGRAGRTLWRTGGEQVWEALTLDTAMGLGILSLVIFACSALQLAGYFRTDPAGVILLAAEIWGIAGIVREIKGYRRESVGRRSWNWGLLAWLLLIALGLAALVCALAPPSMGDWDSLAYHLSVPKLYLHHGGTYYIPFTSHSNFPQLMEMLYMAGLALDGPVAAKLMHFWVGILLVLSVAMLARRHFGARSTMLAVVAFAGMPIVLWEATTAYIDLATALYTVLGVGFLLNYLDTHRLRCAAACGICLGFAASTKMTALAVIPMLALWLLIDCWAAHRRVEWKAALMLVGLSLLACSPYYIKTYIYTGSPVYPFFYSIFGGRDWTQAMARNYSALQASFGTAKLAQQHINMGTGLSAFLLLPYSLTAYSWAYYDTAGLYVGPIFLIAVPVLFAARWANRKLLGLLGFFLAQMVVWFSLSQQSRYLLPAAAVLAVLISGVLYQDDRFRRARIAVGAAFAATAVFGFWTLNPTIVGSAPVALGMESRDSYLARTLDVYPAERFINSLPAKTPVKVAIFGDTRGFYLDRDYVWADSGHNLAFTRDFSSASELVDYLRSQGVTHVMINFRFSFPPREHATGTAKLIYEAIDDGLLKQVFPTGGQAGHLAVYRIK